jgi:hypothetical protein
MTETVETKRKPRAVMLNDEEYARCVKAASRYGDSYSDWGRNLQLQAAERDEQKERGQ